ncbi:MAG: hypothetical protein WC069_01305 [Candidatus Shapirobacteria bacterium]
MNKLKSYLPDKLYGQDVGVLLVWAGPVSVIIVMMLIFLGVILPKITEVGELYSKINKVDNEIKLLNEKRTYLLSLDQADLQSKSTLVENGVLSEKNSYLLVKIISKVVSDFGYSVGDFSVRLGDVKEVDKKSIKFDYQKVPVEVIINGPKSNFLAMVSGIEKSLPVISIDNFNMTGANDVAEIKMNVSAYYLPDWTQTKLESLSVADLTPSKDETLILNRIGSFKYYGDSNAKIGDIDQKYVPLNRNDPFY